MRKCFSAECFLLFRIRNTSSHLHFSQRWNASTKATPLNDDGLLDLLDQVGQDISVGTDPRKEKRKDGAKPYLDESAQEPCSSMLNLPLSPLMDPKLISARQRHRTPKPEPTGPASSLEKKLSKSPYAHALATPVRHCRFTDAKLPSYFLLGFGVTKHPMTGAQWHLPRIAVDPLLMSKEDEVLDETSLEHENADETSAIQSTADLSFQNETAPKNDSVIIRSTETKNLDESPPKEPWEKLPSDFSTVKDIVPQEVKSNVRSQVPDTRTGSSSYFICSQPALKLLTNLKPKSWMSMIPVAWKSDSWIQADKLVWRKDMDEFVLELQRKKTLALLKLLASSRGGYVASCAGYKFVEDHHQVAAVLWLGASTPAKIPRGRISAADPATLITQQESQDDPTSAGATQLQQEIASTDRNSTLEAEVSASEESEPPFYAMAKYKSHFIPIYNLPKLLGHEHLARLRATHSCVQGTMAVIKKKVRTVRAQLELWKLMGYMAQTETLGAPGSKVSSGDIKVLREQQGSRRDNEEGKSGNW